MRNGRSDWEEPADEPALGFVDSLRSSLSTWVAVLKTRIEIISTELEEARHRLEKMLFLAVGGLFFLSFGFLLLTLFIITIFWETDYRLHVLGGFTLLYLGLGVAAALKLKGMATGKSKLFSTTTEELEKDYKALATAKQRLEAEAIAEVRKHETVSR